LYFFVVYRGQHEVHLVKIEYYRLKLMAGHKLCASLGHMISFVLDC